MSYIVSYKNEEYIGEVKSENEWKLYPVNDNLTEQTGEPFAVNGKVDIKNKKPVFIDLDLS